MDGEHGVRMRTTPHLRLAATGLVLGPLLFTLADLLRRVVVPSGTPTPVAITAAVGEHSAAWLAAGLLSLASAICFVPGVVGLLLTTRGRGARLTTVGASLVGLGALASLGHTVAFYAPYALFAEAKTPAPQLTAIDAASESYPLLAVLILLFIVGMMLGPIVLLAGLLRARRVPVWALVAAVVFVASGSTGSPIAGILGLVAAMAAFVPAARSLLKAPSSGPSPVDLAHPAVPVTVAE